MHLLTHCNVLWAFSMLLASTLAVLAISLCDTRLVHLQHKATHVTIICKSCKAIKVITCKPGMGGALVPRVCEGNSVRMGEGAEGCGLDPFVTLPNRSKYVDQQTLKLQVISRMPLCGPF